MIGYPALSTSEFSGRHHDSKPIASSECDRPAVIAWQDAVNTARQQAA